LKDIEVSKERDDTKVLKITDKIVDKVGENDSRNTVDSEGEMPVKSQNNFCELESSPETLVNADKMFKHSGNCGAPDHIRVKENKQYDTELFNDIESSHSPSALEHEDGSDSVLSSKSDEMSHSHSCNETSEENKSDVHLFRDVESNIETEDSEGPLHDKLVDLEAQSDENQPSKILHNVQMLEDDSLERSEKSADVEMQNRHTKLSEKSTDVEMQNYQSELSEKSADVQMENDQTELSEKSAEVNMKNDLTELIEKSDDAEMHSDQVELNGKSTDVEMQNDQTETMVEVEMQNCQNEHVSSGDVEMQDCFIQESVCVPNDTPDSDRKLVGIEVQDHQPKLKVSSDVDDCAVPNGRDDQVGNADVPQYSCNKPGVKPDEAEKGDKLCLMKRGYSEADNINFVRIRVRDSSELQAVPNDNMKTNDRAIGEDNVPKASASNEESGTVSIEKEISIIEAEHGVGNREGNKFRTYYIWGLINMLLELFAH
jgi:hypothetical protein